MGSRHQVEASILAAALDCRLLVEQHTCTLLEGAEPEIAFCVCLGLGLRLGKYADGTGFPMLQTCLSSSFSSAPPALRQTTGLPTPS